MEQKKIILIDFIKYLEEKPSSSVRARLLHVLKVFYRYLHGRTYFVEDFREAEFCKIRSAGKKTWEELEKLKASYLLERSGQPVPIEVEQVEEPEKIGRGGKREGAGRKPRPDNGIPKVQQNIRLRVDIVKTLKTLDNYAVFVETAILNEFERQGIKIA